MPVLSEGRRALVLDQSEAMRPETTHGLRAVKDVAGRLAAVSQEKDAAITNLCSDTHCFGVVTAHPAAGGAEEMHVRLVLLALENSFSICKGKARASSILSA